MAAQGVQAMTSSSTASPARSRAGTIGTMSISACAFVIGAPLKLREAAHSNEGRDIEMTKPKTEELVTGVRAVLLHLLTHMELLVPGFTVSGFRETLFLVEKDATAEMTGVERERWVNIIDHLLPGRP
ncbi:MAG: hypothetical protein BGN83_07560 [Rhizobium sp. 63-7]|nr:MAG: hypothetical protein BGN83_07560 [Rhizobium sp. 63-7]